MYVAEDWFICNLHWIVGRRALKFQISLEELLGNRFLTNQIIDLYVAGDNKYPGQRSRPKLVSVFWAYTVLLTTQVLLVQ